MERQLLVNEFHPFIRCAGEQTGLKQKRTRIAYDYRMIVVLEGSGKIVMNGICNETKTGDVFIIHPGIEYRVISGESQQIAVINFDWTHNNCHKNKYIISVFKKRFDKGKIVELFDLSQFFQNTMCAVKTFSKVELKLCKKIVEEYKRKETPIKDIKLSYLFMEFVYKMMNEEKYAGENDLAGEIYNYMVENYPKQITLNDVAANFHFHPTYVNRVLKKHYGESMKQLLIRLRLERAIYLIDNSDLPIKEIAHEVGYFDAQYFSNAFFKFYGFYPSRRRK